MSRLVFAILSVFSHIRLGAGGVRIAVEYLAPSLRMASCGSICWGYQKRIGMYRWVAGGVVLLFLIAFTAYFYVGEAVDVGPEPVIISEPSRPSDFIVESGPPDEPSELVDPSPSSPAMRPTLPPTGFDETFTSDIAFNAPEEINVGSSVQISLALSPQASGVAPVLALGDGLAGPIRTAVDVSAWPRMEAVLSGPDFEIEPSTAVRRRVLTDRPTQWDWSVRATRPGNDLPLTITLYGLFGEEEDPVHVKTFRETISVDATYWGMLTANAKDLTAVHGAVVAIGGTAFGIIGWLWTRRKRPAADKSPPVRQKARGRR